MNELNRYTLPVSENVTLPDLQIGQPTNREGYMIVARDLLQGVEALSCLTNISPRSCALISAQALECALKAFLCHKGKETEVRRSDIRHNLKKLWEMAKGQDLAIPKAPPDWVNILSLGHGPDFYFRYQEGQKTSIVHGGQTPALISMAAALKDFIEMVDAQCSLCCKKQDTTR